jgi:hypothetical protein
MENTKENARKILNSHIDEEPPFLTINAIIEAMVDYANKLNKRCVNVYFKDNPTNVNYTLNKCESCMMYQ